jgi:type III pantothenate kinase
LTTLSTTLGETLVSGVWVASVAGRVAKDAIEKWSKEQFSLAPVFVSSQQKTGSVINAYDNPEQLGVDRWMALLAAHNFIQKEKTSAALVVDAGTAMTVDAILNDGSHLGGNIIAGLELQQENLLKGTNGIQDSHGEESIWGANTASAVANGAFFALIGAVQVAYQELLKECPVGSDVTVLLSGGDAETLEQYFISQNEFSYSVHINLVLDGLEIYSDLLNLD